MRWLVAVVLILQCGPLFGWSQGGHHLIAQMAFSKLDKSTQTRLVEIIKKHPRFEDDFKQPSNVSDNEYGAWLIGRAAFWPDIARKTEWDRPNWHYQLGSNLSFGNMDDRDVPLGLIFLPPDATLADKDLHIVQAYKLCEKVYRAKATSDEDRAIALCWILHLAGDAHQPCHAGALYEAEVFPKGDRGGNSIETFQSGNLHSLWDGLLGPRYDKAAIRRRIVEIESNKAELSKLGEADVKDLNCEDWIKESQEVAKRFVYTEEVLQWVRAARSAKDRPKLKLSENYLKQAGKVAQVRAMQAAERLANVLSDSAL